MALVVGTNTYADLAYFDAYLATRYNSSTIEALDDSVKNILLESATRALDLFCEWSGYKTDSEQDLEFPRDGEDTPENVKIAQCEIAISIYNSESIVNENEPGLNKMKVDVIEFIFNSAQSSKTLYNDFTNRLLSAYCPFGSFGGAKRLTRV